MFCLADVASTSKGLLADGPRFTMDGEPFTILSGSMHYFRIPRAYWKDRLSALKASGLNTVETYVAWNLHEEYPGQFDYSGRIKCEGNPERSLEQLKKLQPDKPLMVAEFWAGWFDRWGDKHSKMYEGTFTNIVERIFKQNASINFYMFHGGTNFGFMNGANADYIT
uniref:Glycoside hydrolase 35 catalytic domain-containing protein n=1 Tax=Romanomermis culicivorax TaxID=13658 RepID=A0A915JKE6_ROMCU